MPRAGTVALADSPVITDPEKVSPVLSNPANPLECTAFPGPLSL